MLAMHNGKEVLERLTENIVIAEAVSCKRIVNTAFYQFKRRLNSCPV
jgi:hypothetical protein